MKIFQYANYQEYKKIQKESKIRKIDNVWIDKDTVEKIYNFKSDASNILCHGVRNAKELIYFSKFYPNSKTIGTEISTTANNFKNVVKWDFHQPKEEWKGFFDIVYSNSWDHSFDPVKSLQTWKGQLTENGCICIEHGTDKDINVSKASDPLQIFDSEILDIISNLDMSVIHKFKTTGLNKTKSAMVYMIVKNN